MHHLDQPRYLPSPGQPEAPGRAYRSMQCGSSTVPLRWSQRPGKLRTEARWGVASCGDPACGCLVVLLAAGLHSSVGAFPDNVILGVSTPTEWTGGIIGEE